MNGDFMVNVNEINSLIDFIERAEEELYNTIDSIYEGIDAFSEGWQGPSYDNFRSKALEFKPSLEAMVEAYQVFRYLLQHKILEEDVADLNDTFNEAYAMLGGK